MSVDALSNACQQGDVRGALHQLQILQASSDQHDLQCIRESKDGSGRSALHWACASGHTEIAEILMKAGWSCNVCDEVAWTPLHSASSAGHLKTVQLLLDHGAEIDCKNSNGCTPLLYACSKGHRDIVRLLLERRADANLADNNGMTPLHRVATTGRIDLVAFLLNNSNIDINTVDKAGCSPLHLACMERNKEMATELVHHGADPRLQDKKGRVAFSYGSNDQIKYLVSLVTPPESQ